MSMTERDLQLCLYAATTAAYRAGAHVMKYYGQDLNVDTKGAVNLAGDVVTVADREAQAIILEVLSDLNPDIGMLAEEEEAKDSASRFERPYFWCVDPLDGTLPFLERINGFSVSIALVAQSGEPVMGVCNLPAYGDLYHAVAGGGAFRNGQPVTFDPAPPQGTVTLSLNPMDCAPPERNARIAAIAKRLEAIEGVERIAYNLHSGAVAKACHLLGSEPAVFVGVPRPGAGCSLWDLAATASIVAEAGGAVSDIFGDPLELNRRESACCHHRGFVYASSQALADAVIAGYER